MRRSQASITASKRGNWDLAEATHAYVVPKKSWCVHAGDGRPLLIACGVPMPCTCRPGGLERGESCGVSVMASI